MRMNPEKPDPLDGGPTTPESYVPLDLRFEADDLRRLELLDAMGRLAGRVAHDFNNLLTTVLGYSELLMTTLKGNEAVIRDLDEILKSAQRAAQLTDKLLSFGARQRLSARVVDLNEVIARIEPKLKETAGNAVETRLALRATPVRVKIDVERLEEALLALATNAREAMPDGGKLLIEVQEIECGDQPQGVPLAAGRYALLSVSDTGKGLDPVIEGKIFEPFLSTKPKGLAVGMGLATTFGFVKQSGGTILVNSRRGRGTTFRILLPVTKGDNITRPSVRKIEAKPSVLVVEDEMGVRNLVHQILIGAGFAVLEASGGEEALQIAASHRGEIHLLVADLTMPGMSGQELGERLQALRPETRVLYISGHSEGPIVVAGKPGLQPSFLPKPFTPEELVQSVQRVLSGQR